MRRSSSRFSLIRALLASLLGLAAAALLTTTSAAQNRLGAPPANAERPPIAGQINLRGTVGVPQGSLQDNIGGVGGGAHLYLGGWIRQSPVLAGVDIGILNYGRTSDNVPFSRTVGPRIPVDVTTTNNVLETHLSVRLQPRRGRLRPFIEGLVGFKYLFTRTSLSEEDLGDNVDAGDNIASSTNFDDFAFSGGAGAGLDVRVYQPDDPTKRVQAVSLHLGVQYLLGQEAEYLAEGALTDDNGNGELDRSELDVRRSRTTLLQPQFGVTIQLAGDEE